MSAIFPAAVATTAQLLIAINNTKVILDVNAGIGDTTLTVDDASPLGSSGFLTFNDDESNPETISYTGKAGNDLTGVTRGADGTAAAVHTADGTTAIEMRWNAAYHNTLSVELIAVEQNISDRFGVGSTAIAVPSGVTFTLAKTSNQIILGTTRTVTITAPTPASSSRTWTIPDITADGTFAALEGTQTFSGSKSFSSTVALTSTAALTIAKTTNQFVLGTTNTTTISATAPASSAVYTIADVGTSANFVMSAGTQTIGGAKTLTSALIINPTSNQLVLGGVGAVNTVTISAGTPGTTSRTWTIPDISANGTFMALEGTQTVTGSKTFNTGTVTLAGTVNFSALTASRLLALDGSKNVVTPAGSTINAAGYVIGTVVQSASATSGTAFTATGSTYATTNLTVAIAPLASTHKIRITVCGTLLNVNPAAQDIEASMFRGATDLFPGSGLFQGFAAFGNGGLNVQVCVPASGGYLDSPATTSSTTYSVKLRNNGGSANGQWGNEGLQYILVEEIAA